MRQRITTWLNHFDTIELEGIQWPLETNKQKIMRRTKAFISKAQPLVGFAVTAAIAKAIDAIVG